jgi:UDP-N-acetylglucosamine/UDP-N-acetylgalactosamine 4-epimerase
VSAQSRVQDQLAGQSRTWLVTGAAGFIGSNLVGYLLDQGQSVVGLDNFSTGYQSNLDDVEATVDPEDWRRFVFYEGDICDLETCRKAVRGADYVLHQAALGSVPRSIDDPLCTHRSNVDGFINMLVAARDGAVRRFVYAASSSTYGDHPALPKVEEVIGKPLSPYAVTKYINELYADVFARSYGLETVGLRYFNVFGPRQDPQGAYAAVIPRWFGQLLNGSACQINGNGQTSRDFCYIANTVQANVLAATTTNVDAVNQVYNVACGGRTSLTDLFFGIRDLLADVVPELTTVEPQYRGFREGDVLHSQADIGKARRLLGYAPEYGSIEGLELTAAWFLERHNKALST